MQQTGSITIKNFLPGKHNFWVWVQAIIMFTGLIWWRWSPLLVVMAYFFETIIVGIIQIAKMWTVWRYGREQEVAVKTDKHDTMNHIGAIPFFMVHYFFFIAIQSIFVFSFFGSELGSNDAFNLIDNYSILLSKPEFMLVFTIQAVTHIGMVARQWFLPGRYHFYTLKKLFIQPYLRIFIQQFVTILAGFFFIILNTGMAAAILLIVLRLLLDCLLLAARYDEGIKSSIVAYLSKDGDVKPKEIKEQVDAFLDV